jgi:predicted nucleic acid-binding Zn ribbon protein
VTCRGYSCRQGRQNCSELCDLSDEAFEREMRGRRADLFIVSIGVLALVLWALGVIA